MPWRHGARSFRTPLRVTQNKNFLIKTIDSSLLITEYEGSKKNIERGQKFTSVPYKKNLEEIMKRYPSLIKEKQKEITTYN